MSEANTSLTGRWTGKYTYDAGPPDTVVFEAVISESSGALSGNIIEPNTFRPEPTDSLVAVLSGTRSGADVHFTKTYTDFEEDHHPLYEGTCNAALTRISGHWHFPAMPLVSGSFMMIRADAAQTREESRKSADINSP